LVFSKTFQLFFENIIAEQSRLAHCCAICPGERVDAGACY
jgi:hypothetical protein